MPKAPDVITKKKTLKGRYIKGKAEPGKTYLPYVIPERWGVRINNQNVSGQMFLTVEELCNIKSLVSRRVRNEQDLLTDRGQQIRLSGVMRPGEMFLPGFRG